MIVPILKGPSGVAYLQNAFSKKYGLPSDTQMKLPFTTQWVCTLHNTLVEWDEHTNSLASSITREAATQVRERSFSLIPNYCGVLK